MPEYRSPFAQILRQPRLPGEVEHQLMVRLRRGDDSARQELARWTTGLAANVGIHEARRRGMFGDEMHELVSGGLLALAEAAAEYHSRLMVSFVPFAHGWIVEAVRAAAWTLTNPVARTKPWVAFSSVEAAVNDLRHELEREPSVEEIATKMHIPEHDVRDVLTMSLPTVPVATDIPPVGTVVHVPITAETPMTIMVEREEIPAKKEIEHLCKEVVDAHLPQLAPKEKAVVTIRFSLDHDGPTPSWSETARRAAIASPGNAVAAYRRGARKLRQAIGAER